MSFTQSPEVRQKFTPGLRSGVEKPYPGKDGTTTSNASAGSPPYAPGSLSGPITFRYSQNVQGQPCERIRGLGFGPLPRTWMK